MYSSVITYVHWWHSTISFRCKSTVSFKMWVLVFTVIDKPNCKPEVPNIAYDESTCRRV